MNGALLAAAERPASRAFLVLLVAPACWAFSPPAQAQSYESSLSDMALFQEDANANEPPLSPGSMGRPHGLRSKRAAANAGQPRPDAQPKTTPAAAPGAAPADVQAATPASALPRPVQTYPTAPGHDAAAPAAETPVTDIRVTFKPPPASPPAPSRERLTVAAVAQGVDASGHPVAIRPIWMADDPAMVDLSPGYGDEVTLTILRPGKSRLIVAAPGMTKEVAIAATLHKDKGIQVEISR